MGGKSILKKKNIFLPEKVVIYYTKFKKSFPLLTLLSVFLTCLIFPRYNNTILAFVCLVPFLFDLEKLSISSASWLSFFKRGWLWGIIFMSYFHNWILQLHVWAGWKNIILIWICASLYFGIFYGIAMGLYSFVKRKIPILLSFPLIWIIFEWLRALGPVGNSAGSIGYSQTVFLPIVQLASIGGLYTVSLFCIVINVLIFLIIKNLMSKKSLLTSLKYAIAVIFIMGITIFWGQNHYQIRSNEASKKTKLSVALIQANHIQKDKLNRNKWNLIRYDYLKLCQQATRSKPDIIICPETITPTLNLRRNNFIKKLHQISKNNNCNILFGTPIKEDGKYFNSAVVVTSYGIAAQKYKKVQLMPFGEYWPFKGLLKLLGLDRWVDFNDYSSGKDIRSLEIDNKKWGVGICLESIYPWFFRKYVKYGAQYLSVLVNNAWFFQSIAAEEHLQMSIMRAVENNRYLLQAANTGISAIIANNGKIIAKTKLDEAIILNGTIRDDLSLSFYTKTGDIVIYFSIIILLYLFYKNKYKRIK